MAFNHPVEADRVDNIGLFSIVRAPIGILFWVLGGDKHNENEEDDPNNDKISNHKSRITKSFSGNLADLYIAAREESDVSDWTVDESSSNHRLLKKQSSLPIDGSRLPKKKLSWSDESGRLLAFESTEKHEPRPEIVPQRSSLNRSRSVPVQLAAGQESRYLPKSFSKNRSPRPTSGGETEHSGIDSPQWGWYIRTTPPTPEMYCSSSRSLSKPGSSTSTASSRSSNNDNGITSDNPNKPSHRPSKPNPVFQGLQERRKAQAMGWSSVPL